jgi:4-alpha-glucanotransferase
VSDLPHDLAELCRRVGVELGFWHVKGHWVAARPEALCAVLRALGHDLGGPDDAHAALAAHDRAVWAELTPPVAAVHGGNGAALGLRVPAAAVGEVVVAITREDGERYELATRLEELPVTFVADVAGEHMLERRLTLPALAPGYHRAEIRALGRSGETLVIQAPELCHAPPGAMCGFGLFVPLHALGGERGAPIGDLGDLAALARRTRAIGGEVIGTLPLLAGFYDRPFEPSPYSPVSRLFWNELYLDVAALAARLGAPPPAGGGPATTAPVDYRAAYRQRRGALEALATRAWAIDAVRGELEAELQRRPRLDDYARFRAAVETRGEPWGSWPAAERDGALPRAEGEGARWKPGALAAVDDERRRFHVFCQWALGEQLGGLKQAAVAGQAAGLYLDLPVGSSPDGYDLWRERDVFAARMATGAPPDPLQWAGQNWALPPLSPRGLRRTGHRYFIESIRSHAAAATMLRIDHVMGLHRLYWIPDGMTGADGVYVRYPADELWAIVALESLRNRCAIVGEDLGTVPDEVRPTMAARGVHRLFVAQFDWTRDDGPPRPNPAPPGSIAGLATHDTRTFARFVEDEGLGEPAALLAPWLAAMGEGDADLVLVALEDLWLEREPQNVPGTTDQERPNWRQRVAHPPDEALDLPGAISALDALREARKNAATRRGQPPS